MINHGDAPRNDDIISNRYTLATNKVTSPDIATISDLYTAEGSVEPKFAVDDAFIADHKLTR
jgi:hypothetical protein